jgi:diguanylate cyclase (GGDEF)-like protein
MVNYDVNQSLLLSAICLALAVSLGVAARNGGGDSLRLLAWSLLFKSVAHGYHGMHDDPDYALHEVAELLFSALFLFFMMRATLVLKNEHVNVAKTYAFGAFTLLVSMTIEQIFGISAEYLTSIIIQGACLSILLSFPGRTVGLGSGVAAFGMTTSVVMAVAPVAFGMSPGQAVPGVWGSTVFVASYVSIIFISFGFVLLSRDVLIERTRALSIIDPLTGCWNRSKVMGFAHAEMERLRRYGIPVSMIMIDLDFFKGINDRYGHCAGDHVLKKFSERISKCVRETDVLGRWGGDEFLIIMPSSDTAAAIELAERVRDEISREPVEELVISASLGIAGYLPGEDWMAWLARADSAVYKAKAMGRNRVEVYEFASESQFVPNVTKNLTRQSA